jgi:hypothetical protein
MPCVPVDSLAIGFVVVVTIRVTLLARFIPPTASEKFSTLKFGSFVIKCGKRVLAVINEAVACKIKNSYF